MSYYSDSKTEATTSIGDPLIIQLDWLVPDLQDKINFYIESCTVTDLDGEDASQFEIIKDGCYAGVIGAKPHKATQSSDKAVFQYNLFSFNTGVSNAQSLTCEMQFCILTVPG